MGWERRKGKLYYYRKERGAEGVRSLYMGSGQKAIEASVADGIPVPDEVVAQPEKPHEKTLVAQLRFANVGDEKKERMTWAQIIARKPPWRY